MEGEVKRAMRAAEDEIPGLPQTFNTLPEQARGAMD